MSDSKTNSQLIKPNQQAAQEAIKQNIAGLSDAQKQALSETLRPQLGGNNAKLAASYVTASDKDVSPDELTEFASKFLPKQSTPQLWREVKTLPRTNAGKIQRKHLSDYQWQEVAAKPADEDIDDDDFLAMFDDAEYVAPRNDTETVLAKIWAEVLGVDQVSVDDDFLEVGGDSLLSIRILARINKAGLSIATEDFFQYPTIAGQAAAIIKTSQSDTQNDVEIGETTGSFPLTPIQYWFIENIQEDLHHWNQAVMMEVDENRTFANLQRAVMRLHQIHDALRINLDDVQDNKTLDKNWQQHYLPLRNNLALDYVDLSHVDDEQMKLEIEKRCNVGHQSFSFKQGGLKQDGLKQANLNQFILFKTKDGIDNLLVIIVHHLVIDAESWRILFEDLETSWQQYELGMRPELPDKTSSFRLWSEKLREFASSPQALSQIPYWQEQKSQSRLPVDFVEPNSDTHLPLKSQDTFVLSTTLPDDVNAQSIEALAKQLKLTTREVLIYSLLESLYSWGGVDEILLDIESHGREPLFNKVEISRTIGWFTTVFPCLFTRHHQGQLLDSLYAVKDTINHIPNNGIAHGVLKYLESDSSSNNSLGDPASKSQVCFNFLGRVERSRYEGFALGQARSPNGRKAYVLEVNAKIVDEQFVLEWSYSTKLHKRESIEALSEQFSKALRDLISFCATSENTPAYGNETELKAGTVASLEPEFLDDEDDMFDLDNFDDASLDALSNAISNNSSAEGQPSTTHSNNKKSNN